MLSKRARSCLLGIQPEGRAAAVDGNDGAVDEAGIVREQVADGIGDLARAPGPAERMQDAHLVFGPGCRLWFPGGEEGLVPAGGDGSERDSIHPMPCGP